MRKQLLIGALAIGVGASGFAAFSATTAPGFLADGPPSETLRLKVDLTEREIYAITTEGDTLARYGVAIGATAHPTPQGDFHVERIIWNPSWTPPPDAAWARGERATPPGDPNNPMGRVKMFFQEPDYYVHGTNAEWSIGKAVSHGCVRMLNEDVIALAQLVMEHGGERREPGWFRRVINAFRSTREVRLSNPVPIEVGNPPRPIGESIEDAPVAR